MLPAVLCLSAAAPPPDWRTLLRQGDAAYGRGDYAAAAALYEQAQDRTTEPGLAAMDLAAAKIRLAEASDADRARLAQAAEQAYRCCTGPSDPRRTRALCGLGDALLLKADGRDADALEAAVAAYRECLAQPNLDGDLADDARHNLERARLLLRQIAAGRRLIPRMNRPPAMARPSRILRRTRATAAQPGQSSRPFRRQGEAGPERRPRQVGRRQEAAGSGCGPAAGRRPSAAGAGQRRPAAAVGRGRGAGISTRRRNASCRTSRRTAGRKPAAVPPNVPDW